MVCAVPSVSQQKPALYGLKISAESVMLMPSCISVNIKVTQLSMYYSRVISSWLCSSLRKVWIQVWIQDNILGVSSLTRVSCGRSSLSGSEGTFSWLSLFCPSCALIKTVSILIEIILSKAKIRAIIKHLYKNVSLQVFVYAYQPADAYTQAMSWVPYWSMYSKNLWYSYRASFFCWKHGSFLTHLTSNKF